MVQVHLGPRTIEASATRRVLWPSRLSALMSAGGARNTHWFAQEALMKKLLVLAAIAAGVAWFVNKQKQSVPADVWSEASDPV